MRVTLARAAPLCLAFGCDLATFGFPFAQARRRGAKEHEGLATAADIVAFVADGTSIGGDGDAFRALAAAGRFRAHPFPGPWPTLAGGLVATTPTPDAAKSITPRALAESLAGGTRHLALFGLGPRGLPGDVLASAPAHLEITGQGIALETATALAALPAIVHTHLEHLGAGPGRPA